MSLVTYLIVTFFGLVLGSYLNSWIWRARENRGELGKRSVCVHCARQLYWYENIPLLSFIVLRGVCSACQSPIPRDYFAVELVAAVLFLGVTYYYLRAQTFIPWQFWRDLFFIAVLIVVFVYDAKYYLVISEVVWVGTAVAIFINYFILQFSAYSLILGMFIGGGFFLFQYIVSRGRWIGGGDVRLGVMMGALLGWPNILVALFMSYVLGAMVAVPLLFFKKKGMQSQIPFGTFLAVGTLVALFFGVNLMGWYRHLIGW